MICTALTGRSPSIFASDGASDAAPFRREVRGITLEVLATDVTLTRVGEQRPFFSLRDFEAERLRRDMGDLRAEAGDLHDVIASVTTGCVRTIEVVPLAWTGDLLSVRETSETICPHEAHPAGEARFTTFAISRTGSAVAGRGAEASPVPLTQWVPAAAAFTSLRRDALVRRALASASSPPTTLAELVAAAAASPPVVAAEKSCYAFPEDLLERFVPSHVENGKLAFRLGLPGAAVCRTRLTEIGITVPLPRSLRSSVAAAAGARGGFLKRNPPRELAKRPTRIELRP